MRFPKSHRLLYSLLISLLGVCLFGFGQEAEKIQVQTVKVAENVFMLVGGGGNIGVSTGPDGILLIDSQFAELMEKIKAEIAKIQSGPVRIVCNTNWHYDHISSNEVLAKEGALVIAHENTRKGMASEQNFPEFGQKLPAYPEAALPVVTFKESLTLYFNGDDHFS